MNGTDLRFETIEHGGEYPDTMPQAIKLVDAEGRSGRRDIGRRVALDHATESDLRGISGLPPTATKLRTSRIGSFVPQEETSRAAIARLLDPGSSTHSDFGPDPPDFRFFLSGEHGI